MSEQELLRASDADRDAVAEQLCQATVDGRLDYAELEARIQLALAARTYGELGRIVTDLRVRAPRRAGGIRRSWGDPMAAPLAVRAIMHTAYAALPLSALVHTIRMLLVEVLPSASSVVVIGAVLAGVCVVPILIWMCAATFAAWPRRLDAVRPGLVAGREAHP